MCRVEVSRSSSPTDKIKVDMTFDREKQSVNIKITRPRLDLSEAEINRRFTMAYNRIK